MLIGTPGRDVGPLIDVVENIQELAESGIIIVQSVNGGKWVRFALERCTGRVTRLYALCPLGQSNDMAMRFRT